MPTQALVLGMPWTIIQGVTYALPGTLCMVTTSAACETSLDGTTWTAFTSGNLSGAVFIRCAGGNSIVVCK